MCHIQRTFNEEGLGKQHSVMSCHSFQISNSHPLPFGSKFIFKAVIVCNLNNKFILLVHSTIDNFLTTLRLSSVITEVIIHPVHLCYRTSSVQHNVGSCQVCSLPSATSTALHPSLWLQSQLNLGSRLLNILLLCPLQARL